MTVSVSSRMGSWRWFLPATNLLEAAKRLAALSPVVADPDGGFYCFCCNAEWEQGRAQFGGGVGITHAPDCEWVALLAAIDEAERL